MAVPKGTAGEQGKSHLALARVPLPVAFSRVHARRVPRGESCRGTFRLEGTARSHTMPHQLVNRSKSILFAAEGLQNEETADRLVVHRKSVEPWTCEDIVRALADPQCQPEISGEKELMEGLPEDSDPMECGPGEVDKRLSEHDGDRERSVRKDPWEVLRDGN